MSGGLRLTCTTILGCLHRQPCVSRRLLHSTSLASSNTRYSLAAGLAGNTHEYKLRAPQRAASVRSAITTSTAEKEAPAYMANLPKLVPLKVLFGNPYRTSPQVSPDGQTISFLAPSKDKDVLNVWVCDSDGSNERMITEDALRGIRMYRWSEDSKYILYLQDVGGDENFHLFAQPIEPGADACDLTPGEGVRAQNLLTDKQFPQEVLVGLNKRNPQVFDMYRVNLASGESELDTENPGDVLQWVTDADFQIRGAVSMNPADGSTTLRTRQSTDDAHCSGEWKSIVTWPQEENGGPVAFTQDGASMYVESSLGVDTTRLIKIDATNGKEQEVVTYNDKADVGQVVMDDNTRKLLAVSFNYLRKEWKVLDPEVQEDFEVLRQVEDTDFSIGSSSQDEQTWVVSYSRDNGPTANYVYDRRTKKATLLFVNQPALSEYQLSHMEGVVIKARDGLELPAYLSLPVGTNKGDKLPLVLNVHGGPWARDFWGYRPDTQWLTNRGYAVLQVNFRGSTGYGKSFLHQGDKQWGVGTMQHDLTDAVQWAIDQGIADPKRVAIYGGSYGGYACLAGLTFTPDVYCCGVDVVGPSNIQTLFKSIPPYWAPLKKQLIDRVGDVESDEALNKQISPLYHIDNIKVPLLIGQGANDPRVKQAEADQIYEAMKAKGLPVAYYLYKDEGHGFARPPNRLDFYSRVEHFLVEHLGGRAEDPLKVHNTSVVVIDEGHAKH